MKRAPMSYPESVSDSQFMLQYLLALAVISDERGRSEHRAERPEIARAAGDRECSI